MGPHPVMFYIHGGALVFGGGNRSVFDCVNLVTRSIEVERPVVAVNMNYRVGFGGFLASRDIADDLKADGYEGCGNFGFTDQQVALHWIQRYISHPNGSPSNVTGCGNSAGGISISHHFISKNPPIFHRAICMSGVENLAETWTMEQHELQYQNIVKHFPLIVWIGSALSRNEISLMPLHESRTWEF